MNQNTQARRRRGGSAFEHGIVFGIVLGVIQILLYLLNKSIRGAELILAVSIIGLVIVFLMYLFAGIRATQYTGRVGSGAFAGIWTGVISTLMILIISFLLALNSPMGMQQQIQTALSTAAGHINQAPMIISNQLLFNFIAAAGLINLVCAIMLGLLIGFIGGIIGRLSSSRTSQTYPASSYRAAASGPKQNNIG